MTQLGHVLCACECVFVCAFFWCPSLKSFLVVLVAHLLGETLLLADYYFLSIWFVSAGWLQGGFPYVLACIAEAHVRETLPLAFHRSPNS